MTDRSFTAMRLRLTCPDVRAFARWYQDLLGFEVLMYWPEDADRPTYGAVAYPPGAHTPAGTAPDANALVIEFYSEPETEGVRASFVLETHGLADLYDRIRDQVKTLWGPEVYFYQRREVAIEDPGGHMVILSEPTDDPVTCHEHR